MATDKSYSELKDEAKKILTKWAPIFDKCGHLEELDEKLFLANTLENLRAKAMSANGGSTESYTLQPNEVLNIVNTTGTNRLVLSYDEKGYFNIVHQHKDWIND